MKETCLNCRFWLPLDESQPPDPISEGECRRFPPSLPTGEEDSRGLALVTYPMTFGDEWCGEWKEALDG